MAEIHRPIFHQMKMTDYGEDLMEEVLESSIASNYETLKKTVNSRARWFRFIPTVDASGLKKLDDGYYGWVIPKDIIQPPLRKKFRNSNLYKKFIPWNKFVEYSEFFDLMPLVFIRNKLYTNIHIKANEDMTLACFKVNDVEIISNEAVERMWITKDEYESITKPDYEDFDTTKSKPRLPVSIYFIPNDVYFTKTDFNGVQFRNYINSGTPITFDASFAINNRKKKNPFTAKPDTHVDVNVDDNIGLLTITENDNRLFEFTPTYLGSLDDGEDLLRKMLDKNTSLTNAHLWMRVISFKNVKIFSSKDENVINLNKGRLEPYLPSSDEIMTFVVYQSTSDANKCKMEFHHRQPKVYQNPPAKEERVDVGFYLYPGYLVAPPTETVNVKLAGDETPKEYKKWYIFVIACPELSSEDVQQHPTIYNDRAILYTDISPTSPYSGYKNEAYVHNLNDRVYNMWINDIKEQGANIFGPDQELSAGFKNRSYIEPTNIIYNIADYLKYEAGDTDDSLEPHDYKVKKMMELVASDPYYYSQFLKKIAEPQNIFFIEDTKEQFLKRVKTNNHTEITTTVDRREFDENHYLYTFRREDNNVKYVFTLNGRNMVPKTFVTDKYMHCYFPESEIKNLHTNKIDDVLYMEIEKIYSYYKKYNLGDYYKIDEDDGPEIWYVKDGVKKIESRILGGDPESPLKVMNIVPIPLPKGVRVTAQDIHISVDKDRDTQLHCGRHYRFDTRTSRFTAYGMYNLCGVSSDEKYFSLDFTPSGHPREMNLIPNLSYLPINKTAYLSFDENRMNNNSGKISELSPIEPSSVNLYINKFTETYYVKGSNNITINQKFVPDKRNLQIFKNGLLVPESTYDIYFNENNMNGPHTFKAVVGVRSTDVFTFTYSHIKRKVVYSEDLIPENGYIDLETKINKPLSFIWYDFYLNGLKLSAKDIVFITPFKMKIKNKNTRKNFLIYQKGLDLDAPTQLLYDFNKHGESTEEGKVSDPANNLFKSGADRVIRENNNIRSILLEGNVISDLLPDILNEAVRDIYKLFKNFIMKYDKYGLINPDVNQIDKELVDGNPTVFKQGQDFYINPDVYMNLDKDYLLNPDNHMKVLE